MVHAVDLGPPFTAMPTADTWGQAAFVTGILTYTLKEGDVVEHPDGSSHNRGGTTTITIKCADPRVAGTGVETWDSDRCGNGMNDGVFIQWGSTTIRTAGVAGAGPSPEGSTRV